MFVDINAYVGHWPFRNTKYNTLADLDRLAKENDITHMVVANINGFFYKDANAANLELLEELKTYQGSTVFLPMAIVNPSYPEWEKDARSMISAGFAGFELAPIYHGYTLAPQMLPGEIFPKQYGLPVMELAQELNVPVRICASIENFRGRSQLDSYENVSGDELYALLSRNMQVPVLVTSFNVLSAGEKFSSLIKQRPDTYFDTTQLETIGVYGVSSKILEAISPNQLCFGSLSPFAYMETNLLRIAMVKEFDCESIKENGWAAFHSVATPSNC